jgi:membrane associated rhomboid family serine protease
LSAGRNPRRRLAIDFDAGQDDLGLVGEGNQMIIPYSTDAPIYHFPKATVGLIALNVAVHAACEFISAEPAEPYLLILGSGLHPVQWLTHNFLHANLVHLLGNMIFLWSYGILVEGKIGWWPYLLCYLGIGTLHGAVIQVAYLGAEEPSYVLGASAAIFGLMAICMLWAPKNDFHCFYFFFFGIRVFTGTFECPIYVFAILQFVLEGGEVAFHAMFFGNPMSSALLHISGAFWGIVLGVVFLKLDWVDCEGWDVFSLKKKRDVLKVAWNERVKRLDRSRERERLPASVRNIVERSDLTPDDRAAKLYTKVQRSIAGGDLETAETASVDWLRVSPGPPTREQLLAIIKELHAQKGLAASVPAMRAFCRHYPEGADRMRLKLAAVLLRNLSRPTEARRQLTQIAVNNLEERHRAVWHQLDEESTRMIEDGVLEVEEDR